MIGSHQHIRKDEDIEALEFRDCTRRETPQACVRMDHSFSVETAYGTMNGRAGDYLMRGATGALYVISSEDFSRCYRWTYRQPPQLRDRDAA
jgi:hypothetical protein